MQTDRISEDDNRELFSPPAVVVQFPAPSEAVALGTLVEAVVMRLQNKRIRLRIGSPRQREEEPGKG
jgi:hypothetical protein